MYICVQIIFTRRAFHGRVPPGVFGKHCSALFIIYTFYSACDKHQLPRAHISSLSINAQVNEKNITPRRRFFFTTLILFGLGIKRGENKKDTSRLSLKWFFCFFLFFQSRFTHKEVFTPCWTVFLSADNNSVFIPKFLKIVSLVCVMSRQKKKTESPQFFAFTRDLISKNVYTYS